MKKVIFLLIFLLISCKENSVEPTKTSELIKCTKLALYDLNGLRLSSAHGYDVNYSTGYCNPKYYRWKTCNNVYYKGKSCYIHHIYEN